MMENNDCLVVSGIGLVTPLGLNRESTWARLVAGHSAIVPGPQGLEATVKDFSVNGTRSRMGDFALQAAREALAHAGLIRRVGDICLRQTTPIPSANITNPSEKTLLGSVWNSPEGWVRSGEGEFQTESPDAVKLLRVGCAISQSKPVLSDVVIPERLCRESMDPRLRHSGMTGLDPSLFMSSFFGWSSEAVVQRELGLEGPTGNITAACATGVASIELGAYWIRSGQCDVALVGASESSLHPLYQAGFQQMGVLAHGEDPSDVCPFDRNRSGFVMGEGAAVLVLESDSSARRRRHKPLASLLSVKMTHSSNDPIRFDPEGKSIARLIKSVIPECLSRGSNGFPPTTCGNDGIPGYINAHGTGTLVNDVSETRGIRRALGAKADDVPVSSTKAATGHLLGAAGAVEAAFCVLALSQGVLPPTLHLNEPDPECDLDYVPHQARRAPIETALSLSYGFGGQMGAVLFGRC